MPKISQIKQELLSKFAKAESGASQSALHAKCQARAKSKQGEQKAGQPKSNKSKAN